MSMMMSVSLFTACGGSPTTNESAGTQGDSKQTTSGKLEEVSFLLDWIPNTNHTGVYVALEKGFYEEQGIDLTILQPPEESTTALIAAGKADFGVSFQDTMATAFDAHEDFPVVAIATILQHNTSGLISLKEDNIRSFKDLEGKYYATWDDPIEQAMIKQVVENDGGDFQAVKFYHSYVTDVPSALQADLADAVYVYEAWDVILAETLGLEYNFIRFVDAEPALDFYTPVIISSEGYLEKNGDLTKKFLEATKEGYLYAIEYPEESAKILHQYSPEYDLDMLMKSQEFINGEYMAEETRWGYIEEDRWNGFFEWAWNHDVIDNDLTDIGFTNDYLPK